ncbi:MAG TPA: polyprenyl diphosphate synthase [Polyangia bacterium]
MSRAPAHVAIIMDGNGRWAERRGLPRFAGHERGAEAVRRTVTAAGELGIGSLTLHAFSEQNWGRPAAEVDHLMSLLVTFLDREEARLMKEGVRLCTIGDLGRLPGPVRAGLARVTTNTAANQGLQLCLALSYGAREDLASAARKLAEAARHGQLDPAAIRAETLAAALSTHGLPPVDLLIRTSGEQRLSNFLLFECAYAELVFTPTLWSDFDRAALQAALATYAQRERRFGLVPLAR